MSENTKKRVLVVDDDPVQIKLVDGVLSSNGYDVICAQEAAEGLQMAMSQVPDMIILDVMMPIINGFNFCQLLKNEETHKDVPIIMVTSRDEMEDVEIGLKMGANAYLIKPIETDELLKTVKLVENNKVKN